MLRYALRRVALLIPMIFAASVIIFLMLPPGTGDPALDYFAPVKPAADAGNGGLDPRDAGAGSAAYRPVRRLAVAGAAAGFWRFVRHPAPVLDDMLSFLPATLQLAGPRWC